MEKLITIEVNNTYRPEGGVDQPSILSIDSASFVDPYCTLTHLSSSVDGEDYIPFDNDVDVDGTKGLDHASFLTTIEKDDVITWKLVPNNITIDDQEYSIAFMGIEKLRDSEKSMFAFFGENGLTINDSGNMISGTITDNDLDGELKYMIAIRIKTNRDTLNPILGHVDKTYYIDPRLCIKRTH